MTTGHGQSPVSFSYRPYVTSLAEEVDTVRTPPLRTQQIEKPCGVPASVFEFDSILNYTLCHRPISLYYMRASSGVSNSVGKGTRSTYWSSLKSLPPGIKSACTTCPWYPEPPYLLRALPPFFFCSSLSSCDDRSLRVRGSSDAVVDEGGLRILFLFLLSTTS